MGDGATEPLAAPLSPAAQRAVRSDRPQPLCHHASCVAILSVQDGTEAGAGSSDGRRGECDRHSKQAAAGLLILGPSGSGKSGLALELMALGARLVADDRTALRPTAQGVRASAPPGLPAAVEARGIGLVPAWPLNECTLRLVVDLGKIETERMPPQRHITLLGHRLPLLHRVAMRSFPAALLQYLKHSATADNPP